MSESMYKVRVLDDLAHGKPVRAPEPPKEADHAQG
jgi:hypothetical protein